MHCCCNVGLAYRYCLPIGIWDMTIDVSQCHTTEFVNINNRANELQDILNNNTNNSTRDFTALFNVVEVQAVSVELAMLTKTENTIFPNDLSTTNSIVEILIR